MARGRILGLVLLVAGAIVVGAGSHSVSALHLSRTDRSDAAASRPVPPKPASSVGTTVLRGDLSSIVTLTLSGAFSVGQATNLDWDLPLATGDLANGYREAVTSTSFVFSTRPDSQTDLAVAPNTVRRFHWDVPPPNQPLTVIETIHVSITVPLTPLQSRATYPLGAVPAAAELYRNPTTLTQLPTSAHATARDFARGTHSEQLVVERAANWVADSLRSKESGPVDALSVLRSRRASAPGYINTMAAYLRFLQIPVRVEYGQLSAKPLLLPLPLGLASIPVWTMPGSKNPAHSWLEVFFPDAGWVPFDPQAEKFFVDPRHIALFSNADAGDPVDEHGAAWFGRWTAGHPAGMSPIGPPLAGGQTVIVPGDGVASKVVIHSRDSFHARVRAYHPDLRNAQLYAR